ncbi:hypothetical protein EVAR_4687_1 [Eumeta japonica]|uniref:Uncharacterized protein n=1 Tax=Eumeta variegata TaxID=151549 RepID=A0A4C1WQK9_EUMVA|nr:hypothetical protein EVAR_4687_1 [Eumeta japonica]
MWLEEDNTSNITQALSNIFEEMLMATEKEANGSNLDLSQFLSTLKGKTTNNTNDALDFGTLIRLVDGWRSRLNLSKPSSELDCGYCEGNFRDVVLAYNSIHGYISLITNKYETGIAPITAIFAMQHLSMHARANSWGTAKPNCLPLAPRPTEHAKTSVPDANGPRQTNEEH